MTEPRWMTYARTLVGVREIKGPRHSATIMGWLKALAAGRKLGSTITSDEVAWCGTFCAHVFDHAGVPLPKIPERAKSWAGWGRQLLGARAGCVLVFGRQGGGHVGLYVGEDDGDPTAAPGSARRQPAFHVLGGNQGDAVSIVRIAKDRLVPGGMRWPAAPEPLPVARPVRLRPDGVPATTNEA